MILGCLNSWEVRCFLCWDMNTEYNPTIITIKGLVKSRGKGGKKKPHISGIQGTYLWQWRVLSLLKAMNCHSFFGVCKYFHWRRYEELKYCGLQRHTVATHGWSLQLEKFRTELEQNEKSISDCDSVQLVKEMGEWNTKDMLAYNTFSEESCWTTGQQL